jgi:hypothetical protein
MLQGFVHSGKLGGTQECNLMGFKYDVKVVILLLMVCIYQLNLIANTSVVVAIDVVRLDLEENVFSVGASIEKSFQTLVTNELSLFKRFFSFIYMCRSIKLMVDA